MNQRLKKLQAWMKENDVQISFMTSSENVFYLSGFYSDPHERLLALVVFKEKEPFLVCPAMETYGARSSGWNDEIIGCSDIQNPWELIHKAIAKRIKKVHNLAIEKA